MPDAVATRASPCVAKPDQVIVDTYRGQARPVPRTTIRRGNAGAMPCSAGGLEKGTGRRECACNAEGEARASRPARRLLWPLSPVNGEGAYLGYQPAKSRERECDEGHTFSGPEHWTPPAALTV